MGRRVRLLHKNPNVAVKLGQFESNKSNLLVQAKENPNHKLLQYIIAFKPAGLQR